MKSNSKFVSNISICTWNVGSLISANFNKMTDANFLQEIIGHDIILLTETHLGKDENIVLPEYKYYPVCGPRSANKGNNKITELRTILQRESQNS